MAQQNPEYLEPHANGLRYGTEKIEAILRISGRYPTLLDCERRHIEEIYERDGRLDVLALAVEIAAERDAVLGDPFARIA